MMLNTMVLMKSNDIDHLKTTTGPLKLIKEPLNF